MLQEAYPEQTSLYTHANCAQMHVLLIAQALERSCC